MLHKQGHALAGEPVTRKMVLVVEDDTGIGSFLAQAIRQVRSDSQIAARAHTLGARLRTDGISQIVRALYATFEIRDGIAA